MARKKQHQIRIRYKTTCRSKKVEVRVRLGDFCELVRDPRHCYVLNTVFTRGAVLDTLFDGNWAEGTCFRTRVEGEDMTYKVRNNKLVSI